MDCENFEKIPGTDLDEHFVAFGLIDAVNFMAELKKENIINEEEFQQIKDLLSVVEKRCGFVQGDE